MSVGSIWWILKSQQRWNVLWYLAYSVTILHCFGWQMTSTISTWLFHLRYIPSGHWGAAHVNNHVTQSRFVVIKQVSMFLLLYSHLYFLFFSSLHNTRHTRNCARQFNIGQEREAGRLATLWMITFRQNNHPESVIPLTKKRRMTYKWRKSDLKDENWVIF